MDLKSEELEKEIILERDRTIDFKYKYLKLKKDCSVFEEEVKHLHKKCNDFEKTVKMLKNEIYKLHKINDDISFELDKALTEVKYWYNLHAPTLTTILLKYLRKVKECVRLSPTT